MRKVRPSESKWATVGVSAWTAALSAAALLLGSDRAPLACAAACQVAGSPASGSRRKKSPTSGIGLGIGHQHGVVDIPGLLPPRIEDDLLPGVIRVQRGDDALDGVVEQDRADADAHVELEAVGVGEERLVLPDRLAFVVEDRPAAADPARADIVRRHLRLAIRAHDDLAVGIALGHRPRLGLDLLLDLAAEAVGVGEADAESSSARRRRIAYVGLAGQRVDDGGLRVGLILRALVSDQVVDEPGGGVAAG